MPMRFIAVLYALVSAATVLNAGQINWQSTPFAENWTSSGADAPFDERFYFELGVFADGFTPTRANISLWTANWRVADRAAYNTINHFFTSSHLVSDNAAPFSQGKRGYIWGYRINGSSEEWLLVSNPTWLWPAARGINPPLAWSISHSSESIVGTIGSTNDVYHMRSESITNAVPPVLAPNVWKTRYFGHLSGGDIALSDWHADPDGDGLDNLFEYAVDGDPFEAAPPPLDLVLDHEDATITIAKRTDRLVTYAIEESPNLVTWTKPATRSPVEILSNDLHAFSVKWPLRFLESGHGFLRITLTAP